MSKQKSCIILVLVCVSVILISVFTACPGTTEDGEFTISFNLGFTTSKTPPPSITVNGGTAAGSLFPGSPVRATWDFLGWRDSEGRRYTRETIITRDVDLIAHWHFEPGPSNPIFRDRFTTDPAPFVYGDTVYILVGEDALPPDAPPGEYYRMPRWNMYSTQDMKTFKFEGPILASDDFEFAAPYSAWAAQIIPGLDGRFYFYGTVGIGSARWPYQIVVAVADSPTGPYIPVQRPLITTAMVIEDTGYFREDNIDPTVLISSNGRAYIVWGQLQPRIARLSENMIEIERPIWMLFQEEWTSEHRFEEGPWLHKRNGIYYLFFASMLLDETGAYVAETLSYAMADSIHGPWTNGVVISDHALGFGGVGNCFTIHPGVVEFQGMTYMFHHNAALSLVMENGETWYGDTGRRSVCVDYLFFDDEGRPEFIDVRNPAGISVPPRDR